MYYNRVSIFTGLALLFSLISNMVHAEIKLDDATILAIFDQANASDIYNGRLGAKQGQSEEVRALGRMVASEHVVVQQMGRDIANKLNLIPTPPDHDTSVADHAKTVIKLQSASDKEFDKVYLQHEIKFHAAVIDAIKNTLLPAASHNDIKTLLNTVLPGLEHHLAETRRVAKKMNIE